MYSQVHPCFYMYVRIYIYIYVYTYFRWGRCLGCTRENPTRLYTRESNSFVHADADAYDGADGDDDDDDESRTVLSDPNCAVLSDPTTLQLWVAQQRRCRFVCFLSFVSFRLVAPSDNDTISASRPEEHCRALRSRSSQGTPELPRTTTSHPDTHY